MTSKLIFKEHNMSNHDDVNNPAHYDLFPDMQSIDVIRAALTDEEWRGFMKGNIIKYRLRAGNKGDALKCIAKADWYRNKLWEAKGLGSDNEEWPDETRIDAIGQNGNDGAAYTFYALEDVIGDTDLDDWVRWVAIDKNGGVWVYSHKPVLGEYGVWQPVSLPDVRLSRINKIAPPSNYRNCLWETSK